MFKVVKTLGNVPLLTPFKLECRHLKTLNPELLNPEPLNLVLGCYADSNDRKRTLSARAEGGKD